jgi:nanoRNase/pAp phosphatase (c-di-AMP/oligoRNAs hydrolase)
MEEALPRERVSPKEMKDSQLVELYVKIRDIRAQRKAAFENEDAVDKEKQEKIEAILLARFQVNGLESIKTEAGTAYQKTTVYTSVADWPIFFEFMKDNNMWDLMTHSASKTAIQGFRKEKNDLPPGINWREELTIGVRRS